MKASRPFRFLLLWLGFWTGMRATDVWRRGVTDWAPTALNVGRERRMAASSRKRRARSDAAMVVPVPAKQPASRDRRIPEPVGTVRASREVQTRRQVPQPPIDIALAPTPPPTGAPPGPPQERNVIIPVARLALVALPPPILRRVAGSGWLIVRAGGEASVPASQLGGSQAGLRLTYPLDSAQHVALSARVSAPLAGTGKEIALGIDWQPTRAPLHILAEQRLAVDGGASGPMLGLVGGFGPTPVRRGLVLEGYGQSGVVVRRGGGFFADGALRAARPLGAIRRVTVDAGAGLWGGVQPGAGRLDIGPTFGLVLPLEPRMRLVADWRQRVAGPSRPGSGPALSLGTGW